MSYQREHDYARNDIPGRFARIRLHRNGEITVYTVDNYNTSHAILDPENARDMALRMFVHTLNPGATDAEREVTLTKLRLLTG